MSNTGDLIRKYRKEKGFTQKQLGDLCGIADSNIRKYENGRQNPKFETIQKIANALDRETSDFYSIFDASSAIKKENKSSERKSDLQIYLELLGYTVLREENERIIKKDAINFELSESQKETLDKYGYIMLYERPYYIIGKNGSYRLTENEFETMKTEIFSSIEHQLWKHRIKKEME